MPAIREFLGRRPVDAVLVRDAVERMGLGGASRALGIRGEDGRLAAVAWDSGNLIPLGFDAEGLDFLAADILSRHRYASSLVGPAAQVLGLWQRLEPRWGVPREIRPVQYSMVMTTPSQVRPDPALRRARPEEHAAVFPAAVAMFTEEVGYDPTQAGPQYARHVATLLAQGRTFIHSEGGRVIFKADVGARGGGVAQIQGVWTAPEHRGHGIATRAMAAVVNILLAEVAPTVSLYVNDFNHPAVRVYTRVGFRRQADWATVLI